MAKLNLAVRNGGPSFLHKVLRKALWASLYVFGACVHSSNPIFAFYCVASMLLVFHFVAFCPFITRKLAKCWRPNYFMMWRTSQNLPVHYSRFSTCYWMILISLWMRLPWHVHPTWTGPSRCPDGNTLIYTWNLTWYKDLFHMMIKFKIHLPHFMKFACVKWNRNICEGECWSYLFKPCKSHVFIKPIWRPLPQWHRTIFPIYTAVVTCIYGSHQKP